MKMRIPIRKVMKITNFSLDDESRKPTRGLADVNAGDGLPSGGKPMRAGGEGSANFFRRRHYVRELIQRPSEVEN